MDDIADRLYQINNLSKLLTTTDIEKFNKDNEDNFDKINILLSDVEKSLQSYTIPEERVSEFNLNEKKTNDISHILFPIYWELCQQYFSDW